MVGLDIDVAALAWARETHRHARLQFIQRDDLGAGLPDAAFDLITCFEVIEHVAEPMQKAAVQQFARLLAQGGVLVISTPNPEITAKYGENPYHLREMTEAEFDELLCADFSNIAMLKQWVSPGVLIDGQALPRGVRVFRRLLLTGTMARPRRHWPTLLSAQVNRYPCSPHCTRRITRETISSRC